MTLKVFLLTIVLIFGMTTQFNLEMDNNNPIHLAVPTTSSATSLVLKFRFPTALAGGIGPSQYGSSGLGYMQYIGVAFPSTMSTELAFNTAGTPLYSCSLSDGTNTFAVTARVPTTSTIASTVAAETTVAYCQLTDTGTTLIPLRAGPLYTYTLTLTFTNALSSTFIRAVTLFTSTSNHPEKQVIDSLPVIGTLALYGNFMTFTNKLLEVQTNSFTITAGPSFNTVSQVIYPYNTFDIDVTLKSNTFLTAADFLIVFRYPLDTVSGPTSVVSAAINTEALNGALLGNLVVAPFGTTATTGSFYVGGVTENIAPNRNFKLSLKGWTAKDTNVANAKNLEVMVYYKNTYSIVSYVNTILLNIQTSSITLTAGHPENWDIWRNGAWPIKFTLKTNNDLINGGYVQIQHTNAFLDGALGSRLTFIASSCDFADNASLIDNSFGKRPTCNPLRLDHNYPNTPTASVSAVSSGFFFYIPNSISSSSTYTVTIWAFADNCGGSSFDTNHATVLAYSTPSFTATVYRTIKADQMAEARFTGVPILGVSSATNFAQKCWNNAINTKGIDFTTTLHKRFLAAPGVAGANGYDEITFNNASLAGVDILMYREFTNWTIYSQVSASACDGATCLGTQWGAHAAKYIYSTNNALSSSPYLLFGTVITMNAAADLPSLYFPLPMTTVGPARLAGKYSLQLPKDWFMVGDSATAGSGLCYMSVGYNSGSAGAGNQVNNLLQTITAGQTVTAGASFVTNVINQFDSATLLPPNNTSATSITRIVTTIDATNIIPFPNAQVTCGAGTGACIATLNLGFLTTCVKWVASPPTIKSIYSAIDIQFIFYLKASSGLGKASKNMRFIKLYPEGGVFNDVSKFTAGLTATSVRNHFAFGTNQSQNAICLVEISGADLNTIGDTNANTLLVWISFGSLLETDYVDAAATYPTGYLNNGVTAYGLSSQASMHSDNLHINTAYNLAAGSNYLLSVYTNNLLHNYQFFMGSVVYLTGISSKSVTASSGTTQPPLYIPYYCPILLTGITNNNSNRFVPTVIASWATMSGYSTHTVVNSYLSYLNVNRFGTYVSTKTMAAAGVASSHLMASLRFAPYVDTTNATLLYIFNGYLLTAGTAATCSGHVVLINSSVGIAATTSISFTVGIASGSLGVYNPASTKTFYAFGKPFHRVLTFGLGASGVAPAAANFASTTPSDTTQTSTTYVTGVNRPVISTFVNTAGTLTLFDKVGFSCASQAAADLNYLTSYFYSTGTNPIANFHLDWNPQLDGTPVWSQSISFDKTDVYKDDNAGNIKIAVTLPTEVPINTVLTFTALNSAFTGNTICGISRAANVVKECVTTNTSIACTVPVGGTPTYNICCYNITMKDPFQIGTFTVTLTANNVVANGGSTGAASYISTNLYSAATMIASSNFQWVTGNSSLAVVTAARVSRVSYSSQQAMAYGKVTFEITLPREPVRGMRVTLSTTTGDFAAFYLQNIVPRCVASFKDTTKFNETPDSGDILIDACSIATNTSIIVNTKNMVYKCGQAFNKTLFISLWPVNIINFTTTNTLSVKVTMTLNDLTTAIADNTTTQVINSISTSGAFNAVEPVVKKQMDSLCAITSITPPFPGELADYTFGIDLDTNKASLSGTNPNEVTIFFPYWYYGSFLPQVTCFSNGQLNCSFSDEGMLNIRFSSTLAIGSGTKIPVTIVGVRNPAIDTEISFACTVNNFVNNVRTVLMTGSGKLTGGIKMDLVTSLGNLRFLTPPTPVNVPKNPRDTSTHTLRVGIDTAIGKTTLPITFASAPVIHVYFPDEYKLSWYTNKALATIEEYTSDSNNVTTLTSTLSPASVTQSGNRVTITLSQTTFTFASNWRYWDIKISQIVNPIDSTNQQGPPVTQTTKPYYISLTNTSNTVLYRTYSNINTYSADVISPAQTTLPIQWNRGNAFNFDLNKWVVDINSGAFPSNTMTLRPGRYSTAFFSIKTNNNINIPPSVTTLSLTDAIFKTTLNTYTLSTSYMQAFGFFIGCPCTTVQGYYLVNFSMTVTADFAPLAPVYITVDSSTKATLTIGTPPSVPAAASVWVPIYLSESNFEPLVITWTAAPTANNNSSASLTNITIPTATVTTSGATIGGAMSPVFVNFSITSDSTTLSPQSYVTTDPNACFTWVSTSLAFNINGQQAIIPVGLSIPSLFVYSNSDNDATNVAARNSIRFVFTPPVQPFYLFCALVCTNKAFPADASMIFKDYADMARIPASTPLVQHYGNMITATSAYNILFSGLVRGLNYQLKCAIQSTQANLGLRTTSVGSFSTYQGTGNATAVPLTPARPIPTRCAVFNFLNEPGQTTRQGFINYCQRIFSGPGWINNGCVVCTDSAMSYGVPGVVFPSNITCTATTAARRLRFLQNNATNTTSNTSIVNNPVSFSVCPVPSPVCANDASAGNKVYADYFEILRTDLATTSSILAKAGISLVNINETNPSTVITDLVAPDTTKVTFNVTSASTNGAFTFTASTSVGAYSCYYQVAATGTAAPTFQALMSCTDASRCGVGRISSSSRSFASPATNLVAFTAGTSYNIYVGCTNDIPQATLQSAVYTAGTFTIPAVNTPTPVYCPDTYTLIQAGCSSSFLTTSLMALMILFALLF